MVKAACRGLDPEIFILDRGQSSVQAKRVCAMCKMTTECEFYGSVTDSQGVWGGRVLSSRQPRTGQIEDMRPVPVSAPKRSARRR